MNFSLHLISIDEISMDQSLDKSKMKLFMHKSCLKNKFKNAIYD